MTDIPPHAELQKLQALATQLWGSRQHDAAEAAMRRAVELSPDDPKQLATFGDVLRNQDKIDEAAEAFARVNALRPIAAARLASKTLLPAVYESADDLRQRRQRLIDNLKQLAAENFRASIERIAIMPPFPAAYMGGSDIDLQRAFAALLEPPPLPPLAPPPQRQRIRIGFISSALRDHTIGRLNKGLIAQLDRSRFEVLVLSIGAHDDAEARFIRSSADSYSVLPPTLAEARQHIVRQELDVLFYTDIGLEAVTYTLAFSRLAPVQVVTWGHPITTGIPAIDYFISSALLESPGAQQHYTERLVELKNLAVYYDPPAQPAQPSATRRDFGFDANTHLYGCLQSIFKIHPDFDAILGQCLRRDPHGLVLLSEGGTAAQTRRLRDRLSRTIGDVADRVRFLPAMDYPRFLALESVCDVMLDPLHFGGGNTTYEAFAFAVPVITLPSDMLKGRITQALYRTMGLTDCIATSPQHYVELAVRLATDRDARRQVSELLTARRAAIFQNPAGVRDLEEFLEMAVTRARDGK